MIANFVQEMFGVGQFKMNPKARSQPKSEVVSGQLKLSPENCMVEKEFDYLADELPQLSFVRPPPFEFVPNCYASELTKGFAYGNMDQQLHETHDKNENQNENQLSSGKAEEYKVEENIILFYSINTHSIPVMQDSQRDPAETDAMIANSVKKMFGVEQFEMDPKARSQRKTFSYAKWTQKVVSLDEMQNVKFKISHAFVNRFSV